MKLAIENSIGGNMLKLNRMAPLILVSFALAMPDAGVAAEILQSDIVKKLAGKKTSKTRSLTRSLSGNNSGMSKTDKGYLGSLGKTRGIKFKINQPKESQDYKNPTYQPQEISTIGKIVVKYDLPKLDFNIEFEFGSAQISGNSISQVVELAKALQHPDLKDIRIILGGHTDAKGSDGFNQILSQKRSDSVARLVAQIGGIDASRLVPVGFGEHQLKNIHDPHAAENRRVEVINISGY